MAILAVMFASGIVPFALMTRLMMAQHAGWSICVMSLIGAGFVVAWFASTTPMGIDPMLAVSAAFLIFLPAFLGGGMGAVLGYLLLRRRLRMKP